MNAYGWVRAEEYRAEKALELARAAFKRSGWAWPTGSEIRAYRARKGLASLASAVSAAETCMKQTGEAAASLSLQVRSVSVAVESAFEDSRKGENR
jgi:hypothetical protein